MKKKQPWLLVITKDEKAAAAALATHNINSALADYNKILSFFDFSTLVAREDLQNSTMFSRALSWACSRIASFKDPKIK